MHVHPELYREDFVTLYKKQSAFNAPVLVLDLRPESLAAMRERVCRALIKSDWLNENTLTTPVLRAIHPALAKK